MSDNDPETDEPVAASDAASPDAARSLLGSTRPGRELSRRSGLNIVVLLAVACGMTFGCLALIQTSPTSRQEVSPQAKVVDLHLQWPSFMTNAGPPTIKPSMVTTTPINPRTTLAAVDPYIAVAASTTPINPCTTGSVHTPAPSPTPTPAMQQPSMAPLALRTTTTTMPPTLAPPITLPLNASYVTQLGTLSFDVEGSTPQVEKAAQEALAFMMKMNTSSVFAAASPGKKSNKGLLSSSSSSNTWSLGFKLCSVKRESVLLSMNRAQLVTFAEQMSQELYKAGLNYRAIQTTFVMESITLGHIVAGAGAGCPPGPPTTTTTTTTITTTTTLITTTRLTTTTEKPPTTTTLKATTTTEEDKNEGNEQNAKEDNKGDKQVDNKGDKKEDNTDDQKEDTTHDKKEGKQKDNL